MKKPTSLLLALWMLLTCFVSPAFAAGETVTSEITFTNGTITALGLTVQKTVEVAEGSLEPEGDPAFTFTLTVNDTPGRNQPYEYFNNLGRRMVKYLNRQDGLEHICTEQEFEAKPNKDFLIPLQFTTDAYGRFALKADEKAIFIGLNDGDRYVVTEDFMPDGYTQSIPTEETGYTGTASATAESGKLIFRNRYFEAPPEVPGIPGEEPKTQNLEITKNVVAVPGYTMPASDQEFTFRVTVAGELWAGKTYMVLDADGKYVDTRQTTLVRKSQDGDGSDSTAGNQDSAELDSVKSGLLTLKGGQTAYLEGIEQFSSYEVTEILPASEAPGGHWWPVGEDHYSGILRTEDVSLTFTNANASFGVKKTMAPGPVDEITGEPTKITPTTPFTFRLMRQEDSGKDTAWASAPYYLFGADGKPVDTTLRMTDAFGLFKLMADQTAIFVGIAPGTVYSVKEEASVGYKQVTPADSGGYVDQVVQTGNADILHFINDVQDEEITAGLSVSKYVMTESPDFDADTRFVFQVERINQGTPSPLANRPYHINGKSYLTGEDGVILLKSYETAYFYMIATGVKYRVTELGVASEDGTAETATGVKYFPMDDLKKDYYTEPGLEQSDTLTEDGLNLAFYNYYKSTARLQLHKVDAEDHTRPLEGAVFTLEKLTQDNKIDPTFPKITLDPTGADGIVTLEEIVSGRYVLTEITAPTGYKAPQKPFYVEISIRNGTVTPIASLNDTQQNAWIVVKDPEDTGADSSYSQVITGADGGKVVALVIANGFYELPKTGGPGTFLYTLSGLALMSMSLLCIIKRKKYD